MTNKELIALFRAQSEYVAWTDFLENCFEWVEDETEEECEQNLNLFTVEKEM